MKESIERNGFVEMSEAECRELDGGVWWEAAVAAWALYEVGYACGKAIAHLRNGRK